MSDLSRYVDSASNQAELLQALGHETRMEILWTLSETDEPLPFTNLREELDFKDSGNFNYHLDQLTGHFIASTDQGYELRYPGRAVVQTIREGAIVSDPEIPPRTIDLPCPFCGADQVFEYADETLELRCSNCSGVAGEPYEFGTLMSYEFPAVGLRGRTEREVAAAAHRLYDGEVTAMIGEVCPRCSGTVEGELTVCTDHEPGDDDLCRTCGTRYLAWTVYTCSNCGHARQFPPWFNALYLPEVIAFFHEAAGFTRELPFPKFLTDDGTDIRNVTEEIRSTSPLELAITLHLGGAHCTIVVDEQLEITVDEKTVQ